MGPTSKDKASHPDLWAALDRAAQKRKTHEEKAAEARAECRDLVISLLRAGARPTALYGHPFSPAYITKIQREEGLTRAARDAQAS